MVECCFPPTDGEKSDRSEKLSETVDEESMDVDL